MHCSNKNKNGRCDIATTLANKEVVPLDAQCQFCSLKASPPQFVNSVTVSLAVAAADSNRRKRLINDFHAFLGMPEHTTGPQLWRELFLTISDEEQLTEWESRIPNYQCGGKCKKFYLDWKKDNPPEFPLSFDWKWKLKNAVNAKLGQKIMSLDDAFDFWSSQRGNDV